MDNKRRIIFHVDVNSAYLSWEAAYRLQQGGTLDLREVPSVVGGDVESRHGIVLAKSLPAKKCGIHAGETLYSARQKCPELIVVPPHYELYMLCSNSLMNVLKEYTPAVQRFSVDECFLDFTNMEDRYKDPVKLAETIKDRIKAELGFTVNVGVSNCKLLAKVGSDLKKPDMVHTLFPDEIEEKMWPLPVEDLFMVGRATAPKLHKLNIYTIGDLARYDIEVLKDKLKSFGVLIWSFANGIESSDVREGSHIDMKGVGNSTTLPFDVTDRETAGKVLLSLSEMVSMRLRNSHNFCTVIAVHIRTSDFMGYSKQRKLCFPTDSTTLISSIACQLFNEAWRGEPVRHMGISTSGLCSSEVYQMSLFDGNVEKDRTVDRTVDMIRFKYGFNSIMRGVFINSGINSISGGIGEEDYPVMSSIL